MAEFSEPLRGEVWDAAGPRLTAEVLPRALRVLAPLTPPCG